MLNFFIFKFIILVYSVGTNHLDASNIPPTSQFPDSRSSNHLMQTSKACSPIKQSDSNNEESLFDFEGFQENKSYEPFFESDDDSSGVQTFILCFERFFLVKFQKNFNSKKLFLQVTQQVLRVVVGLTCK